MKIRPDEDKKLPLVFDAGDELIGKGENQYVDDFGQPVTRDSLNAELRSGKKKLVRMTVRTRYRSDPPDTPLRRVTVTAVVDGAITAEELGRLVHKMGRSMYAKGQDKPTNG